jgi:diguanylate cyclase (GGDEF)-like protein
MHQAMTALVAAYGWSDLDNAYWPPVLQMASFVFLNMGVYQLYNPSNRRHYALFYTLLLVGVLLSLVRFILPLADPQSSRIIGSVALDVYLFLLVLFCYSRVVPRIGQSGKYEFALLLYFIAHGAHVVNAYVFQNGQKVLLTLELSLPVLFYFLIFMLLFERTIELLQAIYTSSITDTLTGLYNRRYLLRTATQYLSNGMPLAAIFLDIDNFKKLNDTQGHQKGDEALKHVAAILMEVCAEIGVCGRYGGEEMVALLTDPDVPAAEAAEKVRARVEAEAGVTVSVGYAKAKRGISPEALLKQADEAMYKAKTTGKNKVVGFGKTKPIQL